MININQLQIFVSVVDKGSFSAAAEELHLTQPAVSFQIQTLEKRYGVKLFYRNGQRMELTEAGLSLIEPARQLLQQATMVEEHFSAGFGELRGRISLVYNRNSPGVLYLLPPVLVQFRARFSNVQFNLHHTTEDRTLEMLLEHETNFAFFANRPRLRSIETLLLTHDRLVLVLPAGHEWSGQRVQVAQLKGQPFLLRAAGSETRRQTEVALRAAGLSFNDLQVVAEFDSSEAIALSTQAGLGIGFVTELVARHYAQTGKISFAELDFDQETDKISEFRRDIYIARLHSSAERPNSPAQERFWDFLKQQTAHLNEVPSP